MEIKAPNLGISRNELRRTMQTSRANLSCEYWHGSLKSGERRFRRARDASRDLSTFL